MPTEKGTFLSKNPLFEKQNGPFAFYVLPSSSPFPPHALIIATSNGVLQEKHFAARFQEVARFTGLAAVVIFWKRLLPCFRSCCQPVSWQLHSWIIILIPLPRSGRHQDWRGMPITPARCSRMRPNPVPFARAPRWRRTTSWWFAIRPVILSGISLSSK